MEVKRVLIGSRVSGHPDSFRKFLTYLVKLEQNGLEMDYLFIAKNTDEAVSSLLAGFAREQCNTSIINTGHGEQHSPSSETINEDIWQIAHLKDNLIEQARKKNYDYLLLVDADLILHPQTLSQLVKTGKDIISEIVWSQSQQETNELPQAWLQDQYTLYRKTRDETLSEEEAEKRTKEFFDQLHQPGIYEVGGLGKCILISRKALAAGVSFAKIKNLSFRNEDSHFSIRAAAMGFPLYVDTYFPARCIGTQADEPHSSAAEGTHHPVTSSQAKGITISLCMIVKNEEDVLARCLSSVRDITDEIIIVDTGSTDRTKEIAGQFTDKIYDFPWIDDFSAARNFSFNLATQEYILWLDADDYFTMQDRQLLLELKSTLDPTVDSVTMDYHLLVDPAGKVLQSIRRNRLVRRACGFRWIGAVHEYLAVGGKIFNSEIAVKHQKEKQHTDRNLRIYRRRLEAGEEFNPRDLYYYANELRDNAFPEEAVLYYEQFLHTKLGWLEDNIAACLKMGECYGQQGERDKQLQSYFRTFDFDLPRAEACCQIATVFFEENKLQQAIFWYGLATNLTKPSATLGAVNHAVWSWLPHLQLCVCHDRLGNYEKARQHNDIALSYNPTHPSMLLNKLYFEKKLAGK